MGYYIAGSIFLILSGIALVIRHNSKKLKLYEEAERDLKEAITTHDTGKLVDSLRRLRLYR